MLVSAFLPFPRLICHGFSCPCRVVETLDCEAKRLAIGLITLVSYLSSLLNPEGQSTGPRKGAMSLADMSSNGEQELYTLYRRCFAGTVCLSGESPNYGQNMQSMLIKAITDGIRRQKSVPTLVPFRLCNMIPRRYSVSRSSLRSLLQLVGVLPFASSLYSCYSTRRWMSDFLLAASI
jgi:hypothetical protein